MNGKQLERVLRARGGRPSSRARPSGTFEGNLQPELGRLKARSLLINLEGREHAKVSHGFPKGIEVRG